MSCTSLSLDTDFVSPISVVVCDAGAANQIVGLLQAAGQTNIQLAAEGAAVGIFETEFPFLRNLPLEEAMADSVLLISGTSSLASELEHQARVLAREASITSVGVVDHWVNYEQRFIRNGAQVLPDEIWVSDEYAFEIASASFPGTKLCLKKNFYLQSLVEKVGKVSRPSPEGRGSKVLYVLEPILESWEGFSEAGEFVALDYFFEHMAEIGLGADTEICLRPHPTEGDEKYLRWCGEHPSLHTYVDSATPLHEQIASADWVVGCQTFAMVIALHSKRKTLCSLPPHAPDCKLPQQGITMLRDVVGNLKS